jgi:MFS superfamily sulfate permease-like transporter
MNWSRWWRGGAPTLGNIVVIVIAAILAVKVNFFVGVAVGLALAAILVLVRRITDQGSR